MKTTIEYLDALKAKTGAVSDYALAPKIGVTRSAISKYRNQKDFFSDEMCLRVASVLEIDPLLVITSVNAERSKNEETKKIWESLFERLSGVAAMCLLATGITALQPAPANASEVIGTVQEYTLYEIKRII